MNIRRMGLAGVVVLGICAAGAARYFARPWATAPHPAAEYVLVPGDYRRLLNTAHVNRYHMRSPDRDTFDVLIIGDSVVNGGLQTDQADVATSILSDRLGVAVANISAGSWGPPNMLGYVQTFGTFDARVAVVVVSSHDASDVPGASGIDEHTPPVPAAMDALTELVSLLRSRNIRVVIAHHREAGEGVTPGGEAIAAVAASAGLPLIRLEIPASAYRDNIHPTTEGQRLIADQLEPVIREMLRR